MKTLITALFLGFLSAQNAAAACSDNPPQNELFRNIALIVISGILSGGIGYFVGTIKFFREEKHKAYGEMIPPILKMAYNPQNVEDEKNYSTALIKLWLYGSKKVAKKVEYALEIIHDRSKGDVTKALQDAVAEARRDIQIWPWQKLKPEDVNHLYSNIISEKTDPKK